MRQTAVSTALKTLRSAGIFALAGKSRRRNARLLILCYHGLSLDDEHEWLPHLYITPRVFRERLKLLRDVKASVIPFHDGIKRLHAGSLPPRSVAITFDDGMYDLLYHGLPILREFDYYCTLYLTSYYCRYRLPVITLILDYLLWKSGQATIEAPEHGIVTPEPIQGEAARRRVVSKLLKWMNARGLNTVEKDGVARQIAKQLGIDYDDLVRKRLLQIVSFEEARQLFRGGVDLQLHTHRHRTPMDRELFQREIRDNRAAIYDITGEEAVHFCYPSGHYLAEFSPWLRELGVKSATTCERGLARKDSDDFALPRVLDDSVADAVRFESIVSGLLL